MQSEWLNSPAAKLNQETRDAAIQRQSILTKPPGALGQLEDIAIRLAAMQSSEIPKVNKVSIAVFAGDHGVTAQGISAFPQAVTTEMVKNFASGGAAISVLAKSLDADLSVVNMGTVFDPGAIDGVIDMQVARQTQDISEAPAMTTDEFYQALNSGRQIAERASAQGADLFIGGEMGIGNTTSATAIACALTGKTAIELAGPGTGLGPEGVTHKIAVIEKALTLHQDAKTPVEILTQLGGFEIVALTGAFIACAKMGLPVLVDGFIATSAALAASHICDNASNWFIFSHTSAEPGHLHMLESLGGKALLDLGLRLGEGSGAAVAVPLLKLACDLHNNMATFAEAGVSEKDA